MVEKNVPWFSDKDFYKTSVGFESLFKELFEEFQKPSKIQPYPPYNIKKLEDNKYVIEIAVAGFGKSDLEIELDGSTLKVNGSITSTEPGEYLFKGVAERAFTRSFTLADNVEVKNADIVNGLLKIWLEHNVAESSSRKINIGETKTTKK